MMNEAVKSIMSTNLITVSADTKLSEVRQTFLSNPIHHLPVVEGSKLIGLVTTYDLWKNKIAPDQYPLKKVSDVMCRKIAKVRPHDKIGTAAECFLDNRFHALPVVDDEDKLLGIVTSFDVMLYEFKREYKKPILFEKVYRKQSERA